MADDREVVHNAVGKDVSSLRCCVACHSVADSLKMKVMNCLHAMCVPCLGQHLTKDGTVSCFKCLTVAASGMPGVRLEESLADWPVQKVETRGKEGSELQSDHSEKQHVCQSLECEGESSPATSLCVDCGLYMCEGHEKLHLMKKSCRDHQLQSMHTMKTAADQDDTVVDSEFLHCSLHPRFPVKSYCKQCEQLICQRCWEQFHASCSLSVEDISTAAERKRSQWKTLLSDCSDSWREHLGGMNVNIAAHTADINEKVEALSEEIVDDFNTHMKNLQRRQEDLLNELDARRWKALKDLEKQSGIVEKKTFQLDCCEHFVHNLGDSYLLTAEKILQTQIKDIVNSNEEADTSDDHLVDVDFTVSYRAFATDDGEEKMRTSQLGRLVDSASCTEPVKKNAVHVQPVFDRFSCEPAQFSLSSDGHEASHSGEENWLTISTLGSYCHGVVECSVQVSHEDDEFFLGVVEESCEPLEECTPERPFLGWCNYIDNEDYSVGNNAKLGQPWQDGDIIALRLDCDQHTLTGTHQRSGQSETIAVPREKLCFGAEVCSMARISFVR
ncbi:transcription intermediary factor 1-beta-like [Sycon ciliatum]|uniref:transcription intermediary factor 1-beta-like n=1 Tax=Sycon ciliatum TaxID=27933 RepID=UPI0031F71F5A